MAKKTRLSDTCAGLGWPETETGPDEIGKVVSRCRLTRSMRDHQPDRERFQRKPTTGSTRSHKPPELVQQTAWRGALGGQNC